MQIEAYVVTEERLLVSIDPREMSDEWFRDDTVRWIKITSADSGDLEEALRPLELHPRIVDACVNPKPPQAEVLEKVLFMAMPVWASDVRGTPSVRFACVATSLITIQDGPIDFVEETARRFCGEQHLLDSSSAALTFHLVEAMSKTVTPIYLALRTDVDAAAETLEKAPD
ncbi:MAG: hypothetical protein GY851_06250, partial [bacterium]|nr:hypothetical protein [bacterium]